MIKKMLFILMFVTLTVLTIAQNKSITGSVAFTIGEKDLIPEGITYDPVTRQFFVSSINKGNLLFNLPTTCVIDGDHLYCLANTSLRIFFQEKPDYENDLKNPLILKYKLSDK